MFRWLTDGETVTFCVISLTSIWSTSSFGLYSLPMSYLKKENRFASFSKVFWLTKKEKKTNDGIDLEENFKVFSKL